MSVEYTEKNEAYERHSSIYTSYVIEKGAINGRNHYTSEDGTQAIASCDGRSWNIQPSSYRLEICYDIQKFNLVANFTFQG